jgi:hypothetical protein
MGSIPAPAGKIAYPLAHENKWDSLPGILANHHSTHYLKKRWNDLFSYQDAFFFPTFHVAQTREINCDILLTFFPIIDALFFPLLMLLSMNREMTSENFKITSAKKIFIP